MKKTILLLGLLLGVGSSLWADVTDNLSVEEFTITAGQEKKVNIYLTNSQTWSAFQFRLVLPEGLSVKKKSNGNLSFTPTERLNNSYYDEDLEKTLDQYHDVSTKQLEDGSYNVLVKSGNSLDIKGTSGAVLIMTVVAADNAPTGPQKIKMTGPVTEEGQKDIKLTDKTGVNALVQPDTEFDCTVLKGVTIDDTKLAVVDQDGMSLIPTTVTNTDLTYARTLTKAGDSDEMYTVCLPYAPPTADGLKYYELSKANETTLTFSEVASPVAFKPYLVVASAAGSVGTSAAQSVNLGTAIAPVTVDEGAYEMHGTLYGMTNAELATAGAYILQDGGVWGEVTTANAGACLYPFRAYIVKKSGGSARLHSVLSDATGISATKAEIGNIGWFSLDGRKLNEEPTQKGAYIKDGQVIIK